ncbi:MAG: lysine transporter LysE [Thermoproteota archaeon]|nr:MAG: lysine transporter LysE [Candidatus Korarchaeota archaeon]
MPFLDVATQTIIISATGALSPGPLTAISASKGLVQGWKAGFLCALGHMAVEFPLSFLIALGLMDALHNDYLRALIGGIGGLALILFSIEQIRGEAVVSEASSSEARASFLAGVVASGLNPYFIIWWLTIGTKLLSESLLWMGWLGFLVVYALHVWMDYAWLTFVAYLFSLGKGLGGTWYKALNKVLGLTILLLGAKFLWDSMLLLKR